MAEILCEFRGPTCKPTCLSRERFRRTAGRYLAIGLLGLLGSQAVAEPAAYWRWRSNTDGQDFCTQTPPGPGWVRIAGPFRDLQCREAGSLPLRRWAAPPQQSR
ncbi:hypothetical protein [Pseudomonas oryzihabitans]|jgi:hypothetical protein|uniref:hypothetical protein n=1 Tax=Pseudomonas oryzihabitans TaxID=47885 RepID=UPI00210CE5D4|nr:hypothetical protein [Pseudomonas psychrotolerans]